jgi:hypothetical protein
MAAIKIIVTGSNGQLGSELKELAPHYPEIDFLFFTRNELSIADKAVLQNVFELHQPNYFINCAAYTAVDKAEEEKELAFEINGKAVGAIANLCQQNNCKLIHISTDYVFDGLANKPLKESDEVDPVNTYAGENPHCRPRPQKPPCHATSLGPHRETLHRLGGGPADAQSPAAGRSDLPWFGTAPQIAPARGLQPAHDWPQCTYIPPRAWKWRSDGERDHAHRVSAPRALSRAQGRPSTCSTR